MGYQIVTWPMTSRDPERSSRDPNTHRVESPISRKQSEMLLSNNRFYEIVCCEAVWSSILATAWLLVLYIVTNNFKWSTQSSDSKIDCTSPEDTRSLCDGWCSCSLLSVTCSLCVSWATPPVSGWWLSVLASFDPSFYYTQKWTASKYSYSAADHSFYMEWNDIIKNAGRPAVWRLSTVHIWIQYMHRNGQMTNSPISIKRSQIADNYSD